MRVRTLHRYFQPMNTTPGNLVFVAQKRDRVGHGPFCTNECKFENLKHPTKLLFVCNSSGMEHECGDACKHSTNYGNRVMCSLTHTRLSVSGTRKCDQYVVTGPRSGAHAHRATGGARALNKRKSELVLGPRHKQIRVEDHGNPQDISLELEQGVKAATPVVREDDADSKDLKAVLAYMKLFLCPRLRAKMNKKAVETSHEKSEKDLKNLIQGTVPAAKGMPPGPPEPVEHNLVFYTMYYIKRFEGYMQTRFVGHRPPSEERMLAIARMVLYDLRQYNEMQRKQMEDCPWGSVISGSCAGTLRPLSLQDFTLGLLLCLKMGVTGNHGVLIHPPNPLLDFVPPPQFAPEFRNSTCKMIPLQASISLFLNSCQYARTTFDALR
jgi:hypothetical protein